MKYYFTSESVTKGHPDKVADQISDAILDELLKNDPEARCACEVTVEKNACHIMGEVTSKKRADYLGIARRTIKNIGYTDPTIGFCSDNVDITCTLHEQSKDISKGVTSSADDKSIGAGDQGMMFGFATDETKEFMPMALAFARNITNKITELRETNSEFYWLRPDGKSQVTIEYEDGVAKRIDTVVVSVSHKDVVDTMSLRDVVKRLIILPSLPSHMIDENTKFLINPTGRFVECGPAADTGLTGRKIIVDTYGGYAPHGGGAFSGKDATKVDRSGAYVARNIAKTIVYSGLAKKCQVQLSYAIGVSSPVSVYVDTMGTGKVSDHELTEWVKSNYDLRPSAIIEEFGLKKPVYLNTAANGHFGNEDFSWEVVNKDRVISLKDLLLKKYENPITRSCWGDYSGIIPADYKPYITYTSGLSTSKDSE